MPSIRICRFVMGLLQASHIPPSSSWRAPHNWAMVVGCPRQIPKIWSKLTMRASGHGFYHGATSVAGELRSTPQGWSSRLRARRAPRGSARRGDGSAGGVGRGPELHDLSEETLGAILARAPTIGASG
jgi:hypothetical protein